jgi:hypothetical protein
MELDYRLARAGPDYYAMHTAAQSGPLGTSNYRILVEAVPAEGGGKTFMHLTYSYSYGLAGKLAMQAYLGTSGRGKVGFTITGNGAEVSPNTLEACEARSRETSCATTWP